MDKTSTASGPLWGSQVNNEAIRLISGLHCGPHFDATNIDSNELFSLCSKRKKNPPGPREMSPRPGLVCITWTPKRGHSGHWLALQIFALPSIDTDDEKGSARGALTTNRRLKLVEEEEKAVVLVVVAATAEAAGATQTSGGARILSGQRELRVVHLSWSLQPRQIRIYVSRSAARTRSSAKLRHSTSAWLARAEH